MAIIDANKKIFLEGESLTLISCEVFTMILSYQE